MSEYIYCMAPFTGQWFFTPISRPLTSYSEVSRIRMVSILFACAKITRFQWHSEVQLSKIEDIFENDLTYKWGAPKAQWVRLVTNLETLSPVYINHNYFNNKKIKKNDFYKLPIWTVRFLFGWSLVSYFTIDVVVSLSW